MNEWFLVEHLDVNRLLQDWRWLCPQQLSLLARSAFGDLFLRDKRGEVFRLEVSVGRFTHIADSETQFGELAKTEKKKQEWFAEADARACADRGLRPNQSQCIAFEIPPVFRGSKSARVYVADLYECVSFLGDLNRQISTLPDGTKVRLRTKP